MNPQKKGFGKIRHSRIANQRAFSLVELLVVMTIIVIMVSVSSSGFGNITKAFNIGSAGQQFYDQLALARQTALTQNRSVEFRIYQLPDANASSSSTPTVYRAVQSFVVNDASTNAISQVSYLPRGIVINNDTAKSSLIGLSPQNPSTTGAPSLAGYGSNYKYIAFRFRANGEMDVTSTSTQSTWFVTMQSQTDRVADNGLPANYVTVEVNPMTGRMRIDRP